MRIFLLWRRDRGPGASLEPAAVARRLGAVLAPLLAAAPEIGVEERRAVAMVFAHLPVAGWRTPFVQEADTGRAYAIDYPIGARRALAATGAPARELAALGRRLAEDPAALLRELPPPFALVWRPRGADEAVVQTDGLGRAQVLEYDDGALWAATNKVVALTALGVAPELDTTDWAVKSAGGWFTTDRTGYRHVRYLGPGTQPRVSAAGVRRRVDDVLDEWVHPQALAPKDALELGRIALIRHVRDGEPHLERPSAGLTGGWDTRAVVSADRAHDEGAPGRPARRRARPGGGRDARELPAARPPRHRGVRRARPLPPGRARAPVQRAVPEQPSGHRVHAVPDPRPHPRVLRVPGRRRHVRGAQADREPDPPPCDRGERARVGGVEDEDEVFRAVRRAARAEGRRVDATDGPAWNSGPAPPRGYYDRARHWREVAGPVARRVLHDEGAWTEIFDAPALRAAAEPRRSRRCSSRSPTRSWAGTAGPASVPAA